MKNNKFLSFLLFVLAAAVVVAGIWINDLYAESSAQQEKWQGTLREYEGKIAEANEQAIALQSELDELNGKWASELQKSARFRSQLTNTENQLNRLLQQVGFSNANGGYYYHVYTCSEFQNSESFYAHNPEYFRALGYMQCPLCYENQDYKAQTKSTEAKNTAPQNTEVNNTQTQTDTETVYIGNRKSRIFHLQTCHTLPAAKNRIYITGRNTAIAWGYKSCGNCHP